MSRQKWTAPAKEVDGEYDAVALAVAEPNAFRETLMRFGALVGFPNRQYKSFVFQRGEAEWRKKVHSLDPVMLGACYLAMESNEQGTEIAPELAERLPGRQQKTEGETEMPVIAPSVFQGIEPGFYAAVVRDIETETGKFGAQLKFHFQILDDDNKPITRDDGEPQEQWGWTSAKWGPKTKLLDWAKAILRKNCPAEDEPFDTDMLLGKKCDLEIAITSTPQGERTKLAAVYPFRTMSASEDAA